MNISSVSFGATPDNVIRAGLLEARLEGKDTTKVENLMKEIYVDCFIKAKEFKYDKKTGIQYIGLDKTPYGWYKSINLFDSAEGKKLKDILPQLEKRLITLKNNRSKKQIAIDQIESKFNPYPNENPAEYAGVARI